MIAWLAMTVAAVASATKGICNAAGQSTKNGLGGDFAVDHDCGLARVVQQQRRQDQAIPGDSDRPRAEVAHVGVERFGAGRAQEHTAER